MEDDKYSLTNNQQQCSIPAARQYTAPFRNTACSKTGTSDELRDLPRRRTKLSRRLGFDFCSPKDLRGVPCTHRGYSSKERDHHASTRAVVQSPRSGQKKNKLQKYINGEKSWYFFLGSLYLRNPWVK